MPASENMPGECIWQRIAISRTSHLSLACCILGTSELLISTFHWDPRCVIAWGCSIQYLGEILTRKPVLTMKTPAHNKLPVCKVFNNPPVVAQPLLHRKFWGRRPETLVVVYISSVSRATFFFTIYLLHWLEPDWRGTNTLLQQISHLPKIGHFLFWANS